MVAAACTLHGFACLLLGFNGLLLLCWTNSFCCIKDLPLGPALALVSALLSIVLLHKLGLQSVSCGLGSLDSRPQLLQCRSCLVFAVARRISQNSPRSKLAFRSG